MDEKPSLSLFIDGKPIPQPRDRFRVLLPKIEQLVYAPKQPRPLWHWLQKACRAASMGVPSSHAVHAWKESIRFHVCEAMIANSIYQFDSDTPIRVDLVFVHPRPKSKTRKTKANHRYWHAQTPDIDNMQKAVFDALNEYAWTDDCIVCVGTVEDFTAGDGDRSGVAIRISELPTTSIESWADPMIKADAPTINTFF